MRPAAPRLLHAPRAGVLAAVAAFHALAIVALTFVPAARERLVPPSFLYVEVTDAAREPVSQRRALPQPRLREPMSVEVPAPAIALAPEILVAPSSEPRPVVTAASSAPPAPPPASFAPSVEPPRFDMAYLRNPPPAYPGISRRLKEQGRVLLNVLVSPAGEAQDVEVRASSGFERLDRAAMDAVRRWRFVPARRGGDAIAAWALVPIVFELDA